MFDATDKIVTPGLIDLHSHVYEHGTPLGVNSDRVGIEAGVTTIVDCGTAGAAMFPGFRKFVIEGARTRIYALLNISTAGCCTDEIYLDPRLINIDAARAVIAELPTESRPSERNRARQFNTPGRLMPSVVAMRLFATPSPAISNALARVTTRYGTLSLRAHFVRTFPIRIDQRQWRSRIVHTGRYTIRRTKCKYIPGTHH